MPHWTGKQMAGVRPEATRVFGRNPQTVDIPRRLGGPTDGRRVENKILHGTLGSDRPARNGGLVAQPEETPAFGQFVRKRRLHSNLEQHASSEMRFEPLPKPQGRAGSIGAAR
jgi:hypothetical protein